MDLYGINKQCPVLAMTYMDCFLQQHSVHNMDFALVSACSFWIVAKQNEELLKNSHVIKKAILNNIMMAPPSGRVPNTHSGLHGIEDSRID